MTFSEASVPFLVWVQGEHQDKPHTWRRIRTSFVALSANLADVDVPAIGAAHIEQFKTDRSSTVRPVTIRHDLHALSIFFQWAQRVGIANGNPVRLVKVPSDRAAIRIHPLTEHEERAYFAEAGRNPRLYALATIMLGAGLRPGEALHLRVGDIDLVAERATVREGKTAAARRSIRLVGEALRLARSLAAGRAPTDWLIAGRHGRPLVKLNNAHNSACGRAGVHFCLYDLRHTFATRAAERGMPLTTLAAILGHANLRCVLRYVHPNQRALDEAMQRFAAA